MPRIIKTKLSPPKIKNIYWENKKLSRKLSLISEYPLTIIEAPLGYGKSKNLSFFLQKNHNIDDLYWYSIYNTDDNPEDFWYYVINLMFKKKAAGIRTEFEGKDDIDFYQVIDMLLNFLFDEIKKEKVIVLDNYQLITDHRIKKTLSYFIDLLPSNIHLVLLSRNMIDFPQLDGWKVNNKVLYLYKDNFALNKKDLNEFLTIQYNLYLNNNELEKILYIAEGWFAVINYIAGFIVKGVSLDEIFENRDEYFETFYKYLDYEILDNNRLLHTSLKDPLLRSSVFKTIDPEIYKGLIGVKDCKKLIEEFIRIGLPIIENKDKSYCYNRLFKTYLNNRAGKKYDLNDLHLKAYKLYQRAGLMEGQFYHILQLNDKQRLASFIISRAENWIENNRFDLLKTGLLELPESYFTEFPNLYIYRGDLLYSKNRLEQALQEYQKAEEYIVPKKNELKINNLLKICRLYFSLYSIQGIAWLKKIEKHKKVLTHPQKQEYISFKLIAMFISGNVKNTGEIIEQLDDKGVNKEKFKALKAFFEGDIDFAREKIDSIEDSVKDYFLEIIYIMILIIQGKKNEIREILWSKVDISSGSVKLLYKILALISLQIDTDFDKEFISSEYKKLLKAGKESKTTAAWHNRLLSFSFINWEAISGNGEKGINLAWQNIGDLTEKDNFSKLYLYLILGRNYFSNSYFFESEKIFLQARDIASEQGNKLGLAISLFCLVLCKNKRDSNYNKEISNLLKISKEKQYDFLFTDSNILGLVDPNEFVPILIDARKNSIERDYINELLGKINLLTIESHPGYSIRIKTLGRFKLYRGNYRIQKDEWKRSKARDLLFIFLVNYGRSLSREKLYTYLWGEKPEESAKQNFYVTLSSLNKILEPFREPQQETCFVESNNGRYGLSRRFLYYYDTAEFEDLVNRGQNHDDRNIRIKYFIEAIKKYKGDFLPEVEGLSWVSEERQRLRKIFIDIALEVMKYQYKIREYQKVIDVGRKIEEFDSYIDEVYLFKMKSYDKMGKRGKMVKTYRECKEIFHKEMGIEINSKIEGFYRKFSINS